MLQKIQINNYKTIKGKTLSPFFLTYEVFGKALHTAPIVLVNHALTGNSTVTGPCGWWKELIGDHKCIDLNRYTVLSFNIPGNEYKLQSSEEQCFEDYKLCTATDIATIFAKGLDILEINTLHAVIGGSVGGGIAWELAALRPTLIKHLIPVASDWKTSDWLKANCLVQEQILLNSKNPVFDARLHAMLMYRSAASFREKFKRSFNEEKEMTNVESWLLHHGEKLNDRFSLSAYKRLNYILSTIDITKGENEFLEVAKHITSSIHIISIDSDLFFTIEEDKRTIQALKSIQLDARHEIIHSIHGHDAFLIEYDQLSKILTPVFD